MAEALTGCAALLLIVAGLAKIRRPQPAAPMVRSLLPLLPARLAPGAVRAVALGELAAGGTALAIGGRTGAVVLAAAYLLLLAVAVRAARSRGVVGCGCFGTDGGGTSAQVVLDLACLGCVLWAAVRPSGTLAGRLADGSVATGLLLLAESVLLVAVAVLATVRLPELERARRKDGSP